MKINHILFSALLLFAGSVRSEVTFSANTERTTVSANDQIVIAASLVSTKNLTSVPTPRVPSSESYEVLRSDQNQSSSSSIQIVNGRASQKTEISYRFIYVLMPKKTGNFTFPSLEVGIEGASYRTNPITFTVTNTPVQNPDIQVSLLLNKRTLYVGEQTTVTFRVAQKTRSQLQLQRGFSPALEKIEKAFGSNFSVTRLFTNQVKQGQENIGGEMYNTYSLRFAIFPLNEGAFSVPSVPFEYDEIRQTRRRDDDFFSDFFGGGAQAVPKTALSNRLSIDVKSLPTPPVNFTGAVGSFTLNASVNPQTIPTGEALTLKVAVRGGTRSGNVGDIAIPKLNGCEIFTPERHIEVDTGDNGITTTKTYKYMLVPHEEGTLTIPPVSFPYFDPQSGTFKNAQSQQFTVAVTRGKGEAKQQARYLTQEDIREVGKDIRYIKTGIQIKNQQDKPYREPLFYLLYPIPFMLVLFSLLYKFQSVQKTRNAEVYSRQKGVRTAFKAVEQIRKKAKSLSAQEFVGQLSSAIEQYISNKFSFPATGRTLDELKAELLIRNVDEEVVNELTSFIERTDAVRFGGMSFDDQTRTTMLDQAGTFLSSLGKVKKEKKS